MLVTNNQTFRAWRRHHLICPELPNLRKSGIDAALILGFPPKVSAPYLLEFTKVSMSFSPERRKSRKSTSLYLHVWLMLRRIR